MAQGTGPLEVGIVTPPSQLISGNALAMLSILLWAAGFPAAEVLLGVTDPLTLIVMRLALACAALVPIWWVADGKALLKAPWLYGIIMGGFTFGIGTFLLLVAQDLTDAVTVAIVSATAPLLAAFVEYFFGKRSFSVRLIIGLAAAIVGGVICVADNLSLQFGLGAALVLISGGLFVLGSHLAVDGLPGLSPIGRATVPLVGAFVIMSICFGVATLFGWTEPPQRMLTGNEFSMLVIYAVGAMALSQIFFIASVGKIGVTMTSFHINTAPLYVMIIMVALGAAWSWPQAIGGLVVVLGAIYVQARD